MAETRNWVGEVDHPTDEYVDWDDRDPADAMKQLRSLWTQALQNNEAALTELLDIVHTAGRRAGRQDALEDVN